jgi:hypothetical protein
MTDFKHATSAMNAKLAPVQTPEIDAAPVRSVRKGTGEAVKSLFTADCIRIERLLETIQFASVYALIMLFTGTFVDKLFVRLYPVKKTEKEPQLLTLGQFIKTVLVMMLQVSLNAVIIFYTRKIGDIVPFLFNFLCPSQYVSSLGVAETLTAESAIGLVLVGIQTNLMFQLEQMRGYILQKF